MTFQWLYCELLLLPSSLNLEQTSTNLVLSNPGLLFLILFINLKDYYISIFESNPPKTGCGKKQLWNTLWNIYFSIQYIINKYIPPNHNSRLSSLLCIASSTSVYMFSSWLSSSFSCCSMMLFCSLVTLLAVSSMMLMTLFRAFWSGLMGLTPSELSSLFTSCQTSPVCNGTKSQCYIYCYHVTIYTPRAWKIQDQYRIWTSHTIPADLTDWTQPGQKWQLAIWFHGYSFEHCWDTLLL